MTSVQPLLSPDDCFEAEAIAKRDAKVQEALAARYGITDPETQVAHGSARFKVQILLALYGVVHDHIVQVPHACSR